VEDVGIGGEISVGISKWRKMSYVIPIDPNYLTHVNHRNYRNHFAMTM
jgi:hypothetical protein